jgi:ABC-type multidrug transport system ATPase subunit
MAHYCITAEGLTKKYKNVPALDSIDIEIECNSIHAIVGENRSGKTSLVKIFNGLEPFGSYSGTLWINGEIAQFHTIKDGEKAGVATIYQKPSTIEQLSVSENLFLGHELAERGIIRWNESHNKAQQVLKEVGLTIDPFLIVSELKPLELYLLEIAKGLLRKSDIFIFDEPSINLNKDETEHLFSAIKSLKHKGMTCIYTSKKIHEVFEVADFITVLRDGKKIITKSLKDVKQGEIQAMMDGRYDLIASETENENEYTVSGFPSREMKEVLDTVPTVVETLQEPMEYLIKIIEKNEEVGKKLKALFEYYRKKESYLHRLAIKQEYSYKIIDTEDIDFFKVEDGLVFIYAYSERHLLDVPLINIEKRLDPKNFFRVHRNSIVNLSRIKNVIPWGRGVYRLELLNGALLNVSRHRASQFKILIGLDL